VCQFCNEQPVETEATFRASGTLQLCFDCLNECHYAMSADRDPRE
jgi:hypothetical protein